MSNAYRGAVWGGLANMRQADAQNSLQMQQRYAPQMSQYRFGRQQFGTQQASNRMGQRDKMFGFGMNALAGLMR